MNPDPPSLASDALFSISGIELPRMWRSHHGCSRDLLSRLSLELWLCRQEVCLCTAFITVSE